MPYKRTGIAALFSVQGTCSGTCLFYCRWNGQERGLAQPGPYFFEEIGERTPRGFAPWTPAGERVSFPHTPFLWTVVEAAWAFYRRTWPAASKTNASWPAHQLGRAGEVVR